MNTPVWDYNYDNEIYVLSAEHTYTATVTSPTGTEQGYTTYTCHCGDSYIDSYVDATGHEEGEWIIDLEAEVGAEGKKHKECVICHEVLEVAVIEALTHEEQPTEEPTEQPTDEPDEQPTEEVTEQPTEDVTEQPTDEVTEQPTEDATEQLTDVASEEKGCNSSLSFSLAIFTAISLVALLKKRKRT